MLATSDIPIILQKCNISGGSLKLNRKVIGDTRFIASGETLFNRMRCRVLHSKPDQPPSEKWPFGYVFCVQCGLRQTGTNFPVFA